MKLYCAGPMSGIAGYNLPRFRKATVDLEAAGFEVVNPGRRGVIDGYEWVDYMRDSIRDLLTCDAIALLEGWQDSEGARLEFVIAEGLSMPAHGVEWWIGNRNV